MISRSLGSIRCLKVQFEKCDYWKSVFTSFDGSDHEVVVSWHWMKPQLSRP